MGAASASSSAAAQVASNWRSSAGQLNPHRVFDHRWLVQAGVGEDGAQPVDVTIQFAAAGRDGERCIVVRGGACHRYRRIPPQDTKRIERSLIDEDLRA